MADSPVIDETDDWSDVAEAQPELRESNVLSTSRGTKRGGGQRRGRRPVKRLEALQTALSKEMFSSGVIIGMGLPVTGYYICNSSDDFTKAVVQLAQKKTEWVEALENVADIGPGITIGRTVLGIGASIAVDRGRVTDIEKPALKFLGVYHAYQQINDGKDGGHASNGYQPPPHGAFVPVV